MSTDDGNHSGPALWPMGSARALDVQLGDDGLPAAIRRTRRGHGDTFTPVASIEDVWRVAEEWWRVEPHNRTYVRVLLQTGSELTVYLDRRSGEWFEQRYGEVPA